MDQPPSACRPYMVLDALRPWNPGAGRLHAQTVDRRIGGEEHGLIVRATPRAVGGVFRQADDPDQHARGVKDPAAARSGAIDPPLDIHFHAIGDAVGGIRRGHLREVPAGCDFPAEVALLLTLSLAHCVVMPCKSPSSLVPLLRPDW